MQPVKEYTLKGFLNTDAGVLMRLSVSDIADEGSYRTLCSSYTAARAPPKAMKGSTSPKAIVPSCSVLRRSGVAHQDHVCTATKSLSVLADWNCDEEAVPP